ncbi:hypothetical protein GCM10023322_16340 [Rugosimonospora acidiphila]|uniref:LytR/CpsA/Psr regulator C-terminal domain-containing protein n=1 Tax=Rugosimonospora acidiphila TaxID=556531 RepID=A0ABP9RMN4_9ACTN
MSLARARAMILVALLVVAALILVLVAVLKDRQTGSIYSGTCPAGAVKVKTRPLPVPGQIKVNVYNGTDQPGLASAVAEQFRNRGFVVEKTGNAPAFDGVSKLVYGPKELAAATVVNSYFLGFASGDFDIKRSNDVVDVTVGAQYTSLGTKTEVSQSQAQLGNPSPPPHTCDTA